MYRNFYAPATKHSSLCNMTHNVQISESSRIFDNVLANVTPEEKQMTIIETILIKECIITI
jgi:hypothetical protein